MTYASLKCDTCYILSIQLPVFTMPKYGEVLELEGELIELVGNANKIGAELT